MELKTALYKLIILIIHIEILTYTSLNSDVKNGSLSLCCFHCDVSLLQELKSGFHYFREEARNENVLKNYYKLLL